ncbi:MAG: heterodisulfide reductase subunit A, partial [Gammaproteobacteria bacterium]
MKTAAYICQGCQLGERLDTQALATIASREGKMDIVREHPFLCNREGVAMIQKDIEEGADHIVIAACSRRAKTEAFR